MKVIIITQEDSFTVPKNIQKVINLDFVEVLRVVNIDSKQSLVNRKQLFIKGFGLIQSIKMGILVVFDKVMSSLDKITKYKLSIRPRSLESVSLKNGLEYQVISNPNDETFLEELNKLEPDIVVSYSAPLIFKKCLLELPKKGCINLHCSFLPEYAGVMPSFWTLYRKEQYTGTTVHYMDSKIDNGSILGQEKVMISENETMFSLIKKTKDIGGNLMCEVLKRINEDNLIIKNNKVDKEKYCTWPTIQDFRAFRKQGGKLI